MGQYTSQDPIGLSGGNATLYGYVRNPNWWIDPFGLRECGKTIDPATGDEVGRFVVDPKGNSMIEPVGGRTVSAGAGGVDTHTLYPNGSNYQRLNPHGHVNNPTAHGHGHLTGTGPGMRGQGPSIDTQGNTVPWNSGDAHWPIK